MKKARFGDWTEGPVEENITFNVSYKVWFPDGTKTSGRIQVVCETRGQAGERVVRQLKRRDSRAQVEVRRIWEKGKTPGGLYLPPGMEWVDDEIEGKGKKPL